MHRFLPVILLAGTAAAAGAAVSPPPCLLNEVCYDPPGADDGREFVELYVPGPAAVSLAGWRLQFANGAAPGHWYTRWTGAPGDTVPPGGYWLVADRGWAGPPADATVGLDLQNGPDAVRLLAPDGREDRLGYGVDLDPSLSEGAPHPGAPGAALARYPDGRDTDHNDRDWRPADPPTPGAANWPRRGARLRRVVSVPAALPVPGGTVTTRVTLMGTGLEPLPAGPVRLCRDGEPVAAAVAGPLPAMAESTIVWTWRCDRVGDGRLTCRWPVPAVPETVVVVLGEYHCGEAALQLAEIEPRPPTGGSEWVELVATTAVELSDYRLADADGGDRRLPSRRLLPGERVVVAADVSALAAWWWSLPAVSRCGDRTPDAFAVTPAGGWPALNNAPPPGRDYADQVILRDAAGVALDAVVYGRGGRLWPAGHSLERCLTGLAGGRDVWSPSTAPGGATPGCPNAVDAVAPAAALAVEPPQVGRSGTTFRFTVPAGDGRWSLVLYDLRGRLRRHLGGDDLGPGPRRLFWDGTGDDGRRLPPGPCIALWRWDAADGHRFTRRRLVVVRP